MIIIEKIPQTLLKQFCKSYNNRDLQGVLRLLSKDINLWGTAIDEYRIGIKEIESQLQRDWSQSQASEIEILKFIQTPPEALWAAAICRAKITIDDQQHIFDHLRGTITIAKENNEWKITHMHTSFPDMRNPTNHSFPIHQ